MLLEEFENVPAVIEPTDRSIRGGGEICDTIILSFNGEIVERVKQFVDVYEVTYDESLLIELEAIFDKHNIEHIRTKSWTTDAFYRETPDKVKRRLAAGAKVVDMEASAIMAWSQFRKSKVYQFFYTADYVDHHNRTWDARHEERTADAMTFFTIALTIAKELER